MTYRKYDPFIKKLIIETGDKTLFPELNIPRTTIDYWLKESKEKTTTEKNDYYEKALNKLQEDNYILKAKNKILKECLSKLLVEAKFHNPKSKENREFLLDIIEKFKGIIPIKHILDLLNINQSTYYRWQVEKSGCRYNEYIACEVTSPTQLTVEEQQKLIKFANSRDFRKFSTVSLMHYCKRNKILNCSLETWYKYIKLYGIKRNTLVRKSKKYNRGLRAKKVNEIWHIDITEIKMDEQKAYLQLVVDNYSRMIVAWKVSLTKTMNITYKTLLKSFNFVPEFNGKIICDGGSENIGFKPKSLLLGRGIKQLIAKRDIRFSNSMVEAVFRQLKQKFYFKPAKTIKSLYQRLYRFVVQYNNVIPHTALLGGTPREVFEGIFNSETYNQKNRDELQELRAQRREQFRKCFRCEKKYIQYLT